MTKIDIISGFLGAGKTTLIKKLVKECFADEKIVIIENEFGEIGIDGGFLKDAGINITEINSGCICCSLVGDFREALKKVISEYSPDRIIIEPSGAGKLSDIISAVKSVDADNIVLNSFTAVVDAKKCKMYLKNFGEFYNDQIANAKTIILSHTADISEEKLTKCTDLIISVNPSALLVTTDWNMVTGNQLLSAMENGNEEISKIIDKHNENHHDEHCDCGCHDHEHHHHEHHHDEHCDCGCHDHEHHHHEHHHDEHCDCGCHGHEHHHADDVFSSYAIQNARKYTKEELENILENLNDCNKFGTILRAKGIVASQGNEWLHFDFIPGEYDIRVGSADVTGKICVIGASLDKAEIEKLFR